MMRYLITQSLLAAWGYVFSCPEGQEGDAAAAFWKVLNREPTEPTEAMLRGRAFESAVYTAAEGGAIPHSKWEPGVKAVSNAILGAQVQVKLKRDLSVCGMDFLVYGILDALAAGVIYDVKYLNKPMGSAELAGKYLNSPQHPAYLYLVPEAYEFRYLVSDGQDLYVEKYSREETPFIGDIIAEFIDGIRSIGLLETYKAKWQAL